MKSISVLLLVAIALVATWFALGRAPDGGGEREARPASAARGDVLVDLDRKGGVMRGGAGDATRGGESYVRASAANGAREWIRVRSSSDLALESVELAGEDGAWMRHELGGGRLARALVPEHARVRARGHLTQEVPRDAEEIVLEPDFLCVLASDGLRDCAYSISTTTDAGARLEPLRSWLSGFVDERRWAIALDLAEIEAALHGSPPALRFTLGLKSGNSIGLSCEVRHGARAEIELVYGGCESLPLVLRVEGSGIGPEDPVDVYIGCEPPRVRLHEAASSRSAPKVESAWAERRASVDPSAPQEIASLPAHQQVRLTALDTATGRFGSLEFVHDGSPRTIALDRTAAVSGRIVAPAGCALAHEARVGWTGREDGREDAWARATDDAVHVEGDGRFRASATAIPHDADALAVAPSTLVVEVDVRGFQTWQRTIAPSSWPELDLGDVQLIAWNLSLCVRATTPLAPAGRPPFEQLLLGLDGGRVRHSTARFAFGASAGGSQQLFLTQGADESVESYGDLTLLPDRFPHPERATDALALAADGRTACFTLAPDGCLAQVECVPYDVDAEVASQADERVRWNLGWVWHGLPGQPAAGRRVPIGATRLRFEAPPSGVELWWSEFFNPVPPTMSGRGGSTSITPDVHQVRVP